MSKYGNKVPDMLDDMKMYHNSIINHSVSVVGDEVVYSSKQFACQVFIALATGSNGVSTIGSSEKRTNSMKQE